MEEKETVSLAWIDSGTVEGKFAEGMVYAALTGNDYTLRISDMIRVRGIQITRQRELVFKHWKELTKTDWLLCVDSDVVLNKNALDKIFSCADKDKFKMISGVYYVSLNSESTLPEPRICLFNDISEYHIETIKELPENKLIKVDISGMGFLLIHKSILDVIDEHYPDVNVFEEKQGKAEKFVGEDVNFFRKMRAVGVNLYAHTGAFVQHIKHVSIDIAYNSLYWENVHKINRDR